MLLHSSVASELHAGSTQLPPEAFPKPGKKQKKPLVFFSNTRVEEILSNARTNTCSPRTCSYKAYGTLPYKHSPGSNRHLEIGV